MGKTKEDLLNEYYNKFRFVEEDKNKFQEIIFSYAGNCNPSKEKIEFIISNYTAKLIHENGIVDILEKGVKHMGMNKAFMYFNKVFYNFDIDIETKEVLKILDNKSYKNYIQKLKNEYSNEISNYIYPFAFGTLLSEIVSYNNLDEKHIVTDDQSRDYSLFISRFPVLSRDEEQELFTKYHNGDKEAFEELVNHNLRLVMKIASSKQGICERINLSFMDIVQQGNIGLMRAINKFDPLKGYKFSTYASHWIICFINRAINTHGSLVWIPSHMADYIIRMDKFINQFELDHNRRPTDKEIIKGLNIKRNIYNDMISAKRMRNCASIDAPVGHDAKRESDETKLVEILDFQDDYSEEEKVIDEIINGNLRKQEEKAFEGLLTKREADIIRKRFGFDTNYKKTLEEIGKDYGITRERIRQIERDALRKLRKFGSVYIDNIDPVDNRENEYKNKDITTIKNKLIMDENRTIDCKEKGKINMGRKRMDNCEKFGITKEIYKYILEYIKPDEKALVEKRDSGKYLTQDENKKYQLAALKIGRIVKKITWSPKLLEEMMFVVDNRRKQTDTPAKQEVKTEETVKQKINKKGIQTKSAKEKSSNSVKEKVDELIKEEPVKQVKEETAEPEIIPAKVETKTIGEAIEEYKSEILSTELNDQYAELLSMILSDPIMSQRIPLLHRAVFCNKYGLCGFTKLPQSISLALTYGLKQDEVEKIVTDVLCTLREYLVNIVAKYEEGIYQKLDSFTSEQPERKLEYINKKDK